MHPLFDYVNKTLRDKLAERRIMVVYDPDAEFRPFFETELERRPLDESLSTVRLVDVNAVFAQYEGSFFALREQVEPIFASEEPRPILIYVPGQVHDPKGSPLMELERAGAVAELGLARIGRDALLAAGFDDGQIDKLFLTPKVSYDDVVSFLRQHVEAPKPSVLRTIFKGAHGTELITAWLASPERDLEIEEKNAKDELLQLLDSQLGLRIQRGSTLEQARRQCARYILVNEFRADGDVVVPREMDIVRSADNDLYRSRIHEIARTMRERHAERYMVLADGVEQDLGLASVEIPPGSLGAVDTFRFEERALLRYAASRAAEGHYQEVLAIVESRRNSVWVAHDLARQQQWEALRLIAQLGQQTDRVRRELDKSRTDPAELVLRYVADETGWFLMDMAHRRLEAWIAAMEEEPEAEEALALVRREYDEVVHRMATQFSKALQDAGWAIERVMHQTRIFPDVIQPMTGRVAYILADALRFEMGVELAEKLQGAQSLTLRAAIAALPTVTSVGMAALLPDASRTFSVVEHNGKLAARIEQAVLPGLTERKRHTVSRVPDAVDLTLDEVLHRSASWLKKKVADSSLVVVRSQEIDALGETGFGSIAQGMQTVVGNIARAVGKLARVGVEGFVITADHGYVFGLPKDDAMKIEPPMGQAVEFNRRCWVGRGGMTPSASVRVPGSHLGYDTDLDFVFPVGLGVFKAAGSLTYLHGGTSLQEVVIPVLSFRMGDTESSATRGSVTLVSVPDVIVSRALSIRLRLEKALFDNEQKQVLVTLVAGDQHAGETGMAVGANFDRDTGIVTLDPGVDADLALILTREDCKKVRILVQDRETGAILAQSNDIPVRLGLT